MRKVLKGAASALVAAGAMGLAQGAEPPQLLPPAGRSRLADPADAPRDHAEEMRVEMALMADPATFAYAIGARAVDGVVEVRGFAPNEAVKAKALEIAKGHTALQVQDGVKVMSSLAPHSSVGVPVDDVQREAAVLLVEALGEKAYEFHVQAKINGEVTLTGSVGSLKDKWTASRCLRQLHGCSCVLNQLKVDRAGKAADPEPAPVKAPEPVLPPPRIAPPTQAPVPPPPRIAPPTQAPSTPPPAGPIISPPAEAKAAKSSPAAVDVLATPKLPPGWAAVPVKSPTPSPLPSPKVETTALDSKKPEKGSSSSSKVVEASLKTPEPAPALPTHAEPGRPYVALGVAFIGDDVPEPPPAAAPPTAARLKQRVEGACGRQARDVQVTTAADGVLRVKVFLASGVSQDAVAERVLQLPEMHESNVKLTVEVGP